AMGLLSLVIWALLLTISVKYCLFVMRADNHGEGGILALMSLVTGGASRTRRGAGMLAVMGLFGAALIYGDGILTPAISVLSALEGVNMLTDAFKPYVVPLALVILLALFAAQARGTASIGRIFGPIMLLWFVTIAVLGLLAVARRPEVVLAIDPRHAIGFLAQHGWQSFIVLGGVFLAITGGEALYADMGHLGRNPIRISWYVVVLPALLLSYAGQTALLLEDPMLEGNPFFRLAPQWAIIPLVVLATMATIIASQAIITGAFSLTRQAMQLGWFPGMHIHQTSADAYGQIYVPFVNWAMMLGTLALTWGFGSSAGLAGAYGTAVSTTMLLTTALLYSAMRDIWRWPLPVALLVAGIFLSVDGAFFAANLLKLPEGGWIPLLFGVVVFTIMMTWHRGTRAVAAKLAEHEGTPEAFLAELASGRIARVPGTAVFLTRTARTVPPVLLNHVAQIKALAETIVTLTVRFEETPRVDEPDRAEVLHLGDGLWHVVVCFGFIETPNLVIALARAKELGCPVHMDDAVYFAARDDVVASQDHPRLWAWQRMLFAFMYRNAVRASDRFDLPPERFLEIGRQVRL
ncbi:MAG: system potassium uptake protein, partial [Rhodospirillaceae bacterium]|nr:system potassium uptake protein [Rhodospirillaceae bacterium]